MSGLVGYESSSEEEDGIPSNTNADVPAPSSAGQQNLARQTLCNGNHTTTSAHDGTLKAVTGPVLGPSMPLDASEFEQYEEDVEPDLPPMSERDLLRYLTQPSHPMISLPPEPTEAADPAVTDKFRRFLELKAKGVHFNRDLASKSSFKNPSLFANLLERAGLPAEAQYAISLPASVFSVEKLPAWAYKEELLKSQQKLSAELEAEKKAQSVAGSRTIEFTSASNNKFGSQESSPMFNPKRKRI